MLSMPNSATTPDVAKMATTMPSGPSLVFSSTMMSTMVATPMASVGKWICPGLRMVLMARATRLAPWLTYPVKLSSWPSTMLTPTALMKPTITEFETKRSTNPSFSSPAMSMTKPVRMESVKRARAGSALLWTTSTSAMMIAIAPVACTAMNAELVKRAPVKVPSM